MLICSKDPAGVKGLLPKRKASNQESILERSLLGLSKSYRPVFNVLKASRTRDTPTPIASYKLGSHTNGHT